MRTTALITTGAVIALLLLFGCPRDQPPAPSQDVPPAPTIAIELPVSMVLTQRTTTAVPGSKDALQVTIDDITRGQVMASLATNEGKPLLAPTSLKEGDSASFVFENRTYYLTLENLSNELIGDDSALLVLDDKQPSADQSTAVKAAGETETTDGARADGADEEAARIRQLIEHVRSLEGAVFIRNGQEHTAVAAAEHLERKWDYAGNEIQSAEQFIDQLASKSSTTGEQYIIRLQDGTEMASGEYLHLQLDKFAASGNADIKN